MTGSELTFAEGLREDGVDLVALPPGFSGKNRRRPRDRELPLLARGLGLGQDSPETIRRVLSIELGIHAAYL